MSMQCLMVCLGPLENNITVTSGFDLFIQALVVLKSWPRLFILLNGTSA